MLRVGYLKPAGIFIGGCGVFLLLLCFVVVFRPVVCFYRRVVTSGAFTGSVFG